jgi:hypothetical protein
MGICNQVKDILDDKNDTTINTCNKVTSANRHFDGLIRINCEDAFFSGCTSLGFIGVFVRFFTDDIHYP